MWCSAEWRGGRRSVVLCSVAVAVVIVVVVAGVV